SALATRLARAGIDVVVLERTQAWRWRAGGVFSSPIAAAALRRLGLPETTLAAVAWPVPAMRLETQGGAVGRLTYGAESDGPTAVGFDRSALDPALELMAGTAGAEIRRGVTVTSVDLRGDDGPMLATRTADGTTSRLQARIVVGADGPHSIVARAAGVARPARLPARVGLSYHVADPRPRDDGAPLPDARLRVFAGGYVGLAPVPDGRLNVGIVLGRPWRDRLARDGAVATARFVLAGIPPAVDDPTSWHEAERSDQVAGAAPLGGRVTRSAGDGWFLTGDAVGFLDPFTGEGLHRAMVSSELAGAAIRSTLDHGSSTSQRAAAAYHRALRRRFGAKDAVSWLVQSFLAHPALFEYAARRLVDRPDLRATMGLVMGDLVPASRGLDPRFLTALLAP
ncbi:MAG: NAD(P)/FAD-dependent oxidoreductase, partial [Chloroflexi bacterium]|nr:NAD(P)/FAD-dependent oxidoreductase [Chloroflexota bacterium]